MRVSIDKATIGSVLTLYPKGRLAEGATLPANAPRARLLEKRADGSCLLESVNGLRISSVHVPAKRKFTMPRTLIENFAFYATSGSDKPMVESQRKPVNELALIARRMRRADTQEDHKAFDEGVRTSQEEADAAYKRMCEGAAGANPADPALAKLDESARKAQMDADAAYAGLKRTQSFGSTASGT